MADSSLLAKSLSEVAGMIERREVSSADLTRLSLEAIERANPDLNAFITVLADEAMQAAGTADAAIAAGDYRGPLHGVPVAVKDLMQMTGTHTRAGSKVLGDEPDTEDSEAVARLRQSGAVITGKTHMPEFAYWPASANEHYGPVHNPWNRDHDTGGSSSGSGSAVAAGLVFGATGSDTGGSIRMPAALCGIVGLKPTFGLVSGRGAVTLAWSLDHIGPMTRTVRDAALMLNVLAGYDPGDSRTVQRPVPDYAASLDAGVSGLRVAVVSDDGAGTLGTEAVLAGIAGGVAALERAGAAVSEIALPELSDLTALNSAILSVEACAYHEHLLRDRLDELGSIARDRMLGAYSFSPTAFVQFQQTRAVLRQRLQEKLADFDLLVLPGMANEAPPLGENRANTRFTGPFNAMGWPAMVVPTGLGEGNLPVSMQIVAGPWQEERIFRAATVVERDGPWAAGSVAPGYLQENGNGLVS
jgi:Asp-tRNA(Asn)/Glu-tRNA(Gln) amidotransferase A subunit family amidase